MVKYKSDLVTCFDFQVVRWRLFWNYAVAGGSNFEAYAERLYVGI